MRIELNKIVGNFNGKDCFVLVRCGTLGGENLIMTAQKLDVDGMDFFLLYIFQKVRTTARIGVNFIGKMLLSITFPKMECAVYLVM